MNVNSLFSVRSLINGINYHHFFHDAKDKKYEKLEVMSFWVICC